MYCRQRHSEPEYRGVRLAYVPTLKHKYLDTIGHTALSTIHLLFHKQEVALYCNAANAIFTAWPRLRGTPVALNVDGLERNRKKWNRLAKLWYLISERLATWLPNAVITDALAIQQYYEQRYGKTSTFIPYGADLDPVNTTEIVRQLELEPGRYFLYVSRLEPENNALLVRQAFEQSGVPLKLALIGDAPYSHEYIVKVRDTRNPNIVMPGAIYGAGYHELQSHSFAYIHATEVGGTHPALIEAMGRGAMVLYLDTPENAEVARGAGIAFSPATLASCLTRAAAMSDAERRGYSERARARVAERYSWTAVTDRYEELLSQLACHH